MATIRKRGKARYLCWSGPDRDSTGKKRDHAVSLGQVSAGIAAEARRLKDDELRRARLAGVVVLPDGASMPSFHEYAGEYLRWFATEYPASYERTKGIVERLLVPHFGNTALDRLSKTQTERYKVGRDVKPETVAKELRTLQAMMNRAVFLELVQRNPVKGIKPPKSMESKPKHWYSAAEMERIYQHSKPLPGDEAIKGLPINSSIDDFAPMWRLIANTGMRRTEAQQLKWTDVGPKAIRILSTDGARTKSAKWRQVPLSDGASAALKALKRITGRTPHVLPRMAPQSLSRAFKRSARRAGLKGTLHSLRHTFISHMVAAGEPLRVVQVLAGHASITTTEQYAHVAPGYMQSSVSKLKL